MQGIAPRITSIKGLSERTRIPRLGKIRLGKKVKKSGKIPGCACGPEEGCFKCTYPMETPYFVVPPEVAKIYGEKPTELKVKVPVNDLDVIFPQAYKYYGSGRGLKCHGDLQIAYRLNEMTFAMEQVKCPCTHQDKECFPTGTLNIILYEVNKAGVYQITTRSFNSLVDIRSGLLYVGALLGGQFAMVPLILKRIPITTHHKGQKQTHHTLQILLDAASPEFGRKLPAPKENYALPPADEIRPDLDGPVATEEEIREEGPLDPGGPAAGETNSVVTPIKQIIVRTEKDGRGGSVKKFKIITEAGIYITLDDAVKNFALAAMKKVEFVEIEFVQDEKEGNLITAMKTVGDERAQ